MTPTPTTTGYILGIDGGNTKTHALIADLNGQVVGFAQIGCGSYEVLGQEGFAEALQIVTQAALADANLCKADIVGMGFGLAGYDWPSEAPIMEQGIASLKIDAPYRYVNDVVIGLIAGTSEGWGVAVDAGTGNNVRGLDKNGRMGRITGNSVRFGEVGGASELVWRAMISVIYAWSQRGPKTALTQALINYTEVPSEEALIEGLAMERLHLPPSLAKTVFEVAAAGDVVAQEVIRWTSHELGLNTQAVIHQLRLQDQAFEVVLIGSLFNAGEPFIAPLRETIKAFAPQAHLIQLSVPPVVGAVLLAAQACGFDPGSIRPQLVQSTETYLTQFNANHPNHTYQSEI